MVRAHRRSFWPNFICKYLLYSIWM